MTKEGDTPANDVLHAIKDADGTTVYYYDAEDFTVYDAEQQEVGYIDNDNNICIDDEVVARVNDEFVITEEFGAEAEETLDDDVSTEVAEYESQEVDEYEEPTDEDAVEPLSMEEIDGYIDALHKRGMPMSDKISYPKDAVDLDFPPEEISDPESVDGVTAEFRETNDYSFALYRYLIDQIMDQLAPRDYDGVRDYSVMAEDGFDSIISFSDGRSQEMQELAAKITAEKDKAFDFSATLEEIQETFESGKGFSDRLNNLGNSETAKKAKEAAKWAKENPTKAAAGGALAGVAALVSAPLAAAGAAAGGGMMWWNKRKQKAELDPLIKEIQELKKELKPMRGKMEEAFRNLEVAQKEIDRLQDNTTALKQARLVTHRRLCVFIAAGEELERQLFEEVIPAKQKEAEDTNSTTSRNELDNLETALEILKNKLEDMNNSRLLGENDAQNLANMTKGYAKAELKIRSHMSETKPEMDIQLAKADQILAFSSIGEILIHVDKLSDDMIAKSTDMSELAGKTVRKVASRSTVDANLLLEQRRSNARQAAQIEAATRAGTKESRRNLIEAAKDAEKEAGRKERKQILKELESEGKGKSAAARRLRITGAQNDAANGNTPGAGERKKPAGARRTRKTPGGNAPK